MSIAIDLSNRVILVCGVAKGGIGGATARMVAKTGAIVVAVDKTQDVLDPTLRDLEAAGATCHGIVVDLMRPAETDTLIDAVIKRCGRLDGVANVAGGTRPDEWMRLEETPTDSFRDTVNLNLEYTFRICRDAAQYMIRTSTRGSLVNVGSISSLTSAPFHGPYGAAKAAIAALTRTMAVEWQPYGIRANTVHPGAVPTERVMSRVTGTEKQPGSPKTIFTPPDALAQAIVFLLSDFSSGISGQSLTVDSSISANYCVGNRDAASVPKRG